MRYNKNEVVQFIEPVYRFCFKRVNSRHDAEDLTSEIMIHVLSGIDKYNVNALEPWVWRIAHNRYARWCQNKHMDACIDSDEVLFSLEDDYDFVNDITATDEYELVFRYLHTLSSAYKDILVDYYIDSQPVKSIAAKYSLSEYTVKWRLNISRQKIKERIGAAEMDKIYKRINWATTACNGSTNSNSYLHGQVARAICEAAYEKPLSIDEISLKTGLPTMYIEDALPRLISGDAIDQIGGKYATGFIVLRLKDKEHMEKQFKPIISDIANYIEMQFNKNTSTVAGMDFYGHDFGMERLGYIALPYALRQKVKQIKDSLTDLSDGPFPPRKDGGYGWFIIEEATDENDRYGEYSSGCNISDDDKDCIYYYHVNRYFNSSIYHNGTRWMNSHKILQRCENGVIREGSLSEDDVIRLLQFNLIVKSGDQYMLNFPCFTQEQFTSFTASFALDDEVIEERLTNLIQSIHKSFKAFVPKRLDSQINQWVSCFVHSIVGYIAYELIDRGVLFCPDDDKPLIDGVFYVEGGYIDV